MCLLCSNDWGSETMTLEFAPFIPWIAIAALAVLAALEHGSPDGLGPVDALLLDYLLPGMNALELLHEIRPHRASYEAVFKALIDALQATAGNRQQAAQRLGISRAGLYAKLALHGLGKHD